MNDPDRLRLVATRLGDLRDRFVFVGGMVRYLLTTDPAAGPARPTDDVDIIVDVPSRTDLEDLNKQLRARGFREDDSEHAPLCRWIANDVRVDVMPIDPAIYGFSNVWYPSGIAHATTFDGFDGQIRVLDAPHFCATKLEAFASRARGDIYHHDLEDVIALVDGRPTLVSEIASAPDEVREFLAQTISELLSDTNFVEALPGHLAGDDASQNRLPLILDRLRQIAQLPIQREAAPRTRPSRTDTSKRTKLAPPMAARIGRPDQPLRSSNLHAARHDADSSTLTIEFRKGGIYEYYGVPATIYAGLMRASSKGRYHQQWIRTRYRYKRVG